MDIKNRSNVRGGCNSYARFHFHVTDESFSEEENRSVFSRMAERFGVSSPFYSDGLWVKCENRKDFAVIPAIIRLAKDSGFRVSFSIYDCEYPSRVYMDENPEEFWMELALAQAYVD